MVPALHTRRAVTAVVLSMALVLSGCSGVLAGDSAATTTTTETPATATPRETPEPTTAPDGDLATGTGTLTVRVTNGDEYAHAVMVVTAGNHSGTLGTGATIQPGVSREFTLPDLTDTAIDVSVDGWILGGPLGRTTPDDFGTPGAPTDVDSSWGFGGTWVLEDCEAYLVTVDLVTDENGTPAMRADVGCDALRTDDN